MSLSGDETAFERELGPMRRTTIAAMMAKSHVSVRRGFPESAEAILRHCFLRATTTVDAKDISLIGIRTSLVETLLMQGQFDQAGGEVDDIQNLVLDKAPGYPMLESIAFLKAGIQRCPGQYIDAARRYRELYEPLRRLCWPLPDLLQTHPNTVTQVPANSGLLVRLIRYALVLQAQEKHEINPQMAAHRRLQATIALEDEFSHLTRAFGSDIHSHAYHEPSKIENSAM